MHYVTFSDLFAHTPHTLANLKKMVPSSFPSYLTIPLACFHVIEHINLTNCSLHQSPLSPTQFFFGKTP